MRLTTRTNLAMRTLMFCAANPDRIVRKREIALACNASENHLAQVIHLLAQTGYLRTVRGRTGGLTLGCSADHITVGAVFRRFEAGLPFAECFSGGDCTCPLVGACRLKATLGAALDGFYAGLDKVTIADLMRDNTDLNRLLKIG
ncbi:Rrf2 family transcriptional regulator [Pseudotabrizicola sediminis]|uniref:Rrf2 family transcriptional regulator n=1 Tax=Pseudotabrizicola sediminis TaxID=2486418 RepID=A0ABY2KWD6_9RHOB|nr:Rrf2 family transcriptional regulator [Pseudotabrizicola sediminis]TGD45479.1 Rrf2 family transcriptional regulator [Pseudotabrizicola sediminis]TGD63034.1 Rrf2 family transcriptional regulator [Tabrizicola sp. WMC-M-20]